MEVKGQLTRVCSSPRESQSLKSDHQTWRQVPLPTQPSFWAHFPRNHLSSGKSRLSSKHRMTDPQHTSVPLRNKGKGLWEAAFPTPSREQTPRGLGPGYSAAGWWLSLQPQSSFPDQLRKYFHVGPKFLFPVPSHTIFRPSRHFLCWPVPPTSGLSWPLLSGCLQGGPDTCDPGAPGNRFVPSR